jgi:hypothetical protein
VVAPTILIGWGQEDKEDKEDRKTRGENRTKSCSVEVINFCFSENFDG